MPPTFQPLSPDQRDRIARAETLPDGVELYRFEPAAFVLTCSHCRPGRWASCGICPDRPIRVRPRAGTTTQGSQR